MTGVQLVLTSCCSPERVQTLLLTEPFLSAFISEQHPNRQRIDVDMERRTSRSAWSIDLQGELPSVVTRFVGRSADIELTFNLLAMRLALRAEAKREGLLNASLALASSEAGGCTLSLEGSLTVSGAFGGLAETTVRDQIIVPVLEEDLIRLLDEWCTGDSDLGRIT